MRKVNFNKIKQGDLVQVPRQQFAPMRKGWNGWLFSNAIVLKKWVSPKSGKQVIKVEMQVDSGINDYISVEKSFYADCVFETDCIGIAKHFMAKDKVYSKEEFMEFIVGEDVTGCGWVKFLVDKGFLFV